MGRLTLYVAGSVVMANVVLLRAYYERPNFYSAAVYISQSTGSLMFLVNLMLIVAASCGFGLQRLFYGPLRPIETEQLYDKAWFAVSETLLAMTIFRDDIGIWFFTMFLCLLAGKLWQWIGEGRVEFLEQQPPANPRLFHSRLVSSLLLSVAFDLVMMEYCIDSILSDSRPGVMVMFGFEYVLLAIASTSTLLRYALSLVDLVVTSRQEKARDEARSVARAEHAAQRASADARDATAAGDDADDDDNDGDVPGWEGKGRWVFYLDLATDFIKSVVYLGFFMILMTFYGIPIHIMRDLFMTIRSFIKRLHDFVQYRKATRDMNTRYPDATAEELERENTCIVCREEMRPWTQPAANGAQAGRRMDERQRAKKLPCGHILHFSCLRSWLERQQVCPTCRRPVLAQTGNQATQRDNAAGQNQQNPQAQNNYLQALLQGNAAQGAAGAPEAQGQPAQLLAAGEQNQPQGNLRVFNWGPIRIAMGNLRLPAGQQANPHNVREAMNQLGQQAAGNNAPQNGTAQMHNQDSNLNLPQTQTNLSQMGPIPGAVALHPADIHTDILRIQQNIVESVRQLNAQHEQLEVVHRLLGELNRLQQSLVASPSTGQELPSTAPLNPGGYNTFPSQAYVAQGPVLRQNDNGFPTSLTLPEGWTLTPMTLASRSTEENTPVTAPTPPPYAENASRPSSSRPAPASGLAEPNPAAPESSKSGSIRPGSSSPEAQPSSSRQAMEPSFPESGSRFGNVPERIEAEASGSAVAGASSRDPNLTKRTVTVEEVEDNEQ